MYVYFAGAAVSVVFAWKCRQNAFGQRKYYEASLALLAGFLVASLLCFIDRDTGKGLEISRKPPGQGAREKEYLVDADGILKDYSLKVQVEEQKLDKAQRESCLEAAKQELDTAILGENDSLEEVTGALHLPDTLQEGAVEAEYQFSDYEVFHPDGTLKSEPQQPVMVEVTAILYCQEETCLYTFPVRAVPREKTAAETLADKISSWISAENEKEGSQTVRLPEQIGQTDIHWKEKTTDRSVLIVFLGFAGAACILLQEKETKKKEESKRQQQMLLDYPEIVSKLSLLLGAGMNLTLAWEKIAFDYRDKRRKQAVGIRYAYEEMLVALYEIQEGVGELQAIENYGERCGLGAYRKLASLIIQNIRKGAKGMQKLLEEEEREAFEARKARAKKAGEEAGTKLMLPMILMLILVLVILIVPAGLSLDLVG